jgi:hypothetical protein
MCRGLGDFLALSHKEIHQFNQGELNSIGLVHLAPPAADLLLND